jgi:hypothetical protein
MDKLCYQCVLSQILEQEGGFFDDNTSFSRIFGMRHIAHLEYVAPREGDGLHSFLKDLVCCEVNVKKCLQGACVGRVLERLQSTEEDCEIFLKLPQLFHGAEQHSLLKMHDQNAVKLFDGCLCIHEGDQYKPVRVRTDMPVEENGFLLSDSAMQAGSAHVIFRWPDEELKIEKRNSGEVKITLCSPVYDRERLREQTFDAPTEAGTLLEPDTWLYRRVSEFRRNHGASDRQKLDPLDLLQLRCAVNLGEKGLIAGVLHILSNGRFRSCSRKTAKGSEFDLWVCGGNCLWSADEGNAGWRQLCKRLQYQIGDLASSPDLGLLISALNEDDDLDQLKAVIASKDPKLGGVDGVTEEHLLAEVQSTCAYVGGQYLPMREIEVYAYAPFLHLVHDQTFKYDAAPQLNFTDGWCYDPVLRSARRIRPSDGATLSCGYSYPEFDQSKYDPLEAFLKEVHPDKEVLAFRLSELAKCLNMKQSDVTVLFCHGTAGAGKGLTTQLFVETFGDYGHLADKALFAKQSRVDAEAPSTARLKLKNKLYVAADEVNNIDRGSLTAWCGGGKIPARGLYKTTESFPAMFNLTEMTFNDLFTLKKDEGLDRRIYVIRFSTVFIKCKDEKEATKMEEEWKKDGETGRATMYDAKYERMMALKSQLMAHLILIHQKGEFVEKCPPPPKIAEWTAKLWAGSAAENPLQKPMELWYGPCGCRPRDAADDTTRDLWDRDGNHCNHTVQAKEIMELKGMQLESGESMYQRVKGARAKSDQNILEFLKKVRIGSPPLRLECKERHAGERNVFFGLLPLANAFPQQIQQCHSSVPM